METICEACKTKLLIPDHKVPQAGKLSASCPKCKSRLSIVQTTKDSPDPPAPHVAGTPQTLKQVPATTTQEEGDPIFDAMEMDGTLALVMAKDPKQGTILMRCAENLGYRPVLTSNTRDAVGKIRLHHFDLLMLSEGFDNVELLQSPILDHLNHLSMSIRRKMFLVLISEAFRTADNMMAFSMSANLVVNPKSLDKLPSILQRAQRENRLFYKVFFDVLEETGKT